MVHSQLSELNDGIDYQLTKQHWNSLSTDLSMLKATMFHPKWKILKEDDILSLKCVNFRLIVTVNDKISNY